jgi:uncharacterized SAM-binding protein YcdF (DUF218 family)
VLDGNSDMRRFEAWIPLEDVRDFQLQVLVAHAAASMFRRACRYRGAEFSHLQYRAFMFLRQTGAVRSPEPIMFFIIAKLLGYLVLPSNLIGLIAVVGLVLMLIGRPRFGRGMLIAAILLLFLTGWSPVGRAALALLENRFPQPAAPARVAGVVVLGGAIDTHISFDRSTVAVADAGERITAAAELGRRYADARIILSGGASHLLFDKAETESALTRDLLVRVGVPASRIELEERSRNTCENAVESRAVAAPRPGEVWLLVTSASHMPRAVACFRAAGFPIIPYPVDFRTLQSDPWRPASSIADGLEASDLAAHEWLGLLAYHFARHTALFPAP